MRASEMDGSDQPDYCVVEVSGVVTRWVQDAFLKEGRWVPSGHKDYMLRVDSEDPAIPVQRHVHIAHKKHDSAPNKQVAWNIDGSRHDKHKFSNKLGSNSKVQAIARQALELPDETRLEAVMPEAARILLESSNITDRYPFDAILLRLKEAI
jgi:hypothetical protein